MRKAAQPRIILEQLHRAGVDLVVIGGVAAVLQGAPISTFDLALVHSRYPTNVERLVAALAALDAYYREQRETKIRPSAALLVGPGHHLLMTTAGPLDLLGTVTGGRGYDELLPAARLLELGEGLAIQVLDLAMIIQLKEELGRDKDHAALPILRGTLEARDRP